MKKIMVCVLCIAILAVSAVASAKQATTLTAEQFVVQRTRALQAYRDGIQKNLSTSWLRKGVFARKYVLKEVTRLTGWDTTHLSILQAQNEPWVDWELLDVMGNYLPFLGTTYLVLVSALTEPQLAEFKKMIHPSKTEYAPLIAPKPNWQKDWSTLSTGLPNQKQILHRLLAIEFLQQPYHILEGSTYNYVRERQQGMSPQLMAQLAEELPWFNDCVQDTLTAVLLNHKYSEETLDMRRMFSLLKQQQTTTQHIEEKVAEMKWEIGDTYIRRYLQILKLDQNDKSLSLLERLQAEKDLQLLPVKVKRVAQYCVAVHISAHLLQSYNDQYARVSP